MALSGEIVFYLSSDYRYGVVQDSYRCFEDRRICKGIFIICIEEGDSENITRSGDF